MVRPLIISIILLVLTLHLFSSVIGCSDKGMREQGGAGPSLPAPDAVIPLENLSRPVHVFIDDYGIPHIYGFAESDVLRVQGYLHARDRFTEMDLLRHVSSGRVAEITGQMRGLGPLIGCATALTVDWFLRTLFTTPRGNRIAEEVLDRASPEILLTIDSFIGGINAYIKDLREGRNGARLAPHYRELFGVREDRIPEYTPEDIINLGVFMGFFLSGLDDMISDITYTEYFRMLDQDILSDTLRSAPADPTTVLSVAPWKHSASESIPFFPPSNLVSIFVPLTPSLPRDPATLGYDMLRSFFSFAEILARRHPSASNNWVIAPSNTKRGYALIANDQHLALLNPPIYYHSHLNTTELGKGDLNVIGVSFAGFPGVTTGHNEYVAWGQTVMGYDQLDIYSETAIGERYDFPEAILFRGEVVPVQTTWETFRIGYGPESQTLSLPIAYTNHHGPILPYSTKDGRATSIRWVGQEPFRDTEGLYLLDRAHDVYEFAHALKNFDLASFHWVFADIFGNIGYSGHARIPVRQSIAEFPPCITMPGTGEAEWKEEYMPEAYIPVAFNPPEGYFNTSNNDIYGTTLDNNPFNDPSYYFYTCDIGFRARRIRDLIQERTSGEKVTFEDMTDWQADTRSLAAARILPFLFEAARGLPQLVTPRMEEALERLRVWDYTSPTGVDAFYRREPPSEEEIRCSVGASIFHAWLNQVLAATFTDEYAHAGQDLPDVDMQTRALLLILEHPAEARTGQRLFDDITTEGHMETPDEIMLQSLEAALGFLWWFFATENMDEWRWGKLHQSSFVLGYEDLSLPSFPVQGPFPKSGANFTVDASDFGSDPHRFTNTYGPNTRFVMELEPGVLRAVNAQPGGQSEYPEDPHYGDLTELWLDNRYHELYFWWDDVLDHRETYLRFDPKEPR